MGRKIAFHYRCSWRECRTRRTLPRPLEAYQREPACKCCGNRLTLDKYRQEHGPSDGRPTCHCSGLHYPHRLAGSVWCDHHPTGPTEQDFIERYGPECLC